MGDFVQLVDDLRKAQKKYFKTRDKNDLKKAKVLEKCVDESLKKFTVVQKTLFD